MCVVYSLALNLKLTCDESYIYGYVKHSKSELQSRSTNRVISDNSDGVMSLDDIGPVRNRAIGAIAR